MRAKGVVVKFVMYLLADWSNIILNIHDDFRWAGSVSRSRLFTLSLVKISMCSHK